VIGGSNRRYGSDRREHKEDAVYAELDEPSGGRRQRQAQSLGDHEKRVGNKSAHGSG
jgi:hypothetical protein